jgi:hypothetical protein
MRHSLITTLGLGIITVVLASGCKKEDETPPPNTAQNYQQPQGGYQQQPQGGYQQQPGTYQQQPGTYQQQPTTNPQPATPQPAPTAAATAASPAPSPIATALAATFKLRSANSRAARTTTAKRVGLAPWAVAHRT